MDYQSNNITYFDKRSSGMATASLVLGIISLATCACIYLAIPCAAMGIILGILSRGGEMTYSQNGKIGLVLSAIGFGLTILVYALMFLYTISVYGGIEPFMNEINNIMSQYGYMY